MSVLVKSNHNLSQIQHDNVTSITKNTTNYVIVASGTTYTYAVVDYNLVLI